jgi:DNA polymerase-4
MKLVQANYDYRKPLRSIGVRVNDLTSLYENVQLSLLFDNEIQRQKRIQLETTIDKLRQRFGHYSIGRAVYSFDEKLRQFDARGDHTIHPVGYFSGPL